MNLTLDRPTVSPFPRALSLFLRQRSFVATIVALLAIDIGLVWLTAWVEAPLQETRVMYMLYLAPCLIPAVIGTAMWSRGADLETNVPFPLRWPRLLHLSLLSAIGIGGSAIAVGSWLGRVEDVHQGAYWLRYSAVALALALIAARTIGPRFAWLPPMLLVIAVSLVRERLEPIAALAYPWWLWVLRRTDDPLSWLLTVTLLIFGGAMFILQGSRPDDPGEG